VRRRSWAAKISGPYSTKLPSSSRSARFSRAVRCPDRVACLHRGEIGALARGAAGAGLRGAGRLSVRRLHGSRLEHQQQLALLDGVADGDGDASDHAVGLGEHLVLHLHRLEHDQRRAGADALVGAVRDRDHDARELGSDGEL